MDAFFAKNMIKTKNSRQQPTTKTVAKPKRHHPRRAKSHSRPAKSLTKPAKSNSRPAKSLPWPA